MKARRLFIIFCAALLLAGGLLVWFAHRQSESATPSQESKHPPVAARVLDVVSGQAAQRKAAEQRWLTGRNGAVQFFARAIDQNGRPISGVTISADLSRSVPASPRPVQNERIELVSDTDGHINLAGTEGISLRVLQVQKEGYSWTDPGLGSFDFRPRNIPSPPPDYFDPSKRFVFKLWRKGTPEPLVSFSRKFKVEEKDDDFFINVLSAPNEPAFAEQADLRVRLRSVAPDDPGRKYERELILEAPTGGIVETPDAYLYEARQSGYARQTRYLVKPTDLTFGGWKQKFYLQTRNGKVFAGFEMSFTLFPHAIELQGLVNPNASRNLEPDPAKQITDPEEIRRLDEATRTRP